MKALFQLINSKPQYVKLLEWGKLITITGSAQILVQILALTSGILIIRLLPTHEYALYTIANTMLGTMTLLSDGGISANVMSQGGQVWQNKAKLGQVIVTGLVLRKRFGIACLLIASPILGYLLLHHGASLWMTSLIILSLIPAFFASLSDSLLEVAPKLNQDITPLQKNQVYANTLRFVFTTLTLFIFPWTFIAILAAGISRTWANFRLKKISTSYVDFNQRADPEKRRIMLLFVKRVIPTSVYYCFSGQISIWLISFYGKTSAIAEVGALSRLSIMATIFSTIFGTLLLPRFSRLTTDRRKLFNYFLIIEFLVIAYCISIILIIYVFSNQILQLLGSKYLNLNFELLLTMIGSCISMLAGVSFSLYSNRGWMISPILIIIIDLIAITIGLNILDISSIQGVLQFNIITSSFLYLSNTIFLILKIIMIHRNKRRQFFI